MGTKSAPVDLQSVIAPTLSGGDKNVGWTAYVLLTTNQSVTEKRLFETLERAAPVFIENRALSSVLQIEPRIKTWCNQK